jgi:uncharacterized protein YdhG (YjbR/CyaY superfamily)
LTSYAVNKKTVRVPIDWKVDAALLDAMIRPQLTVTRKPARTSSRKSSHKSKRTSSRNVIR